MLVYESVGSVDTNKKKEFYFSTLLVAIPSFLWYMQVIFLEVPNKHNSLSSELFKSSNSLFEFLSKFFSGNLLSTNTKLPEML